MNAVKKSRITLMAVLLVIIALAHLLAFKLFIAPKKADSGERPAETGTPAEETAEAPASTFRFRQLSANPNFGLPFHFAAAVDGDLPNLPLGQGATTGFMVDLDSRNVLWMKNRGRSVPIASMAKMMTLLTAFEILEERPELSLDTMVKITATTKKNAPKEGIIWLDPRETMPLRDLLAATAIKSANDAAYQVAEFLADGDVNAFVARMNRRAGELGMPGTSFSSPSGYPNPSRPDSLSTPEAMTILGERLLEYPQLMTWLGTQQTFIERKVGKDPKTELTNTNRLINPRYPGVDGLKTGYTKAAGCCLTFSALRNGRRIAGCVTGFERAANRDKFVRQLIDWSYERLAEIDAGKLEPPTAAALTAKKRK